MLPFLSFYKSLPIYIAFARTAAVFFSFLVGIGVVIFSFLVGIGVVIFFFLVYMRVGFHRVVDIYQV